MIRNYFKVAMRNIMRQKFYSGLNIMGLSIGIAACLLIVLYLRFELSYDTFHTDIDRIYQVDLHGKIAGQEIFTATTCSPMAQALENEVPEVEMATRLLSDNGYVMRYGERAFTENSIMYADSNFFRFFSFPLLEGDAANALREPRSLVMTEEMAQKYFGSEPAVGKTIQMDESYTVTGVVANVPKNSHFRFDFLISSASLPLMSNGIWLNNNLYTYLKLRPNTGIEAFPTHFAGFVSKYIGPEVEQFMGITLAKFEEQGGEFGYYLTPMKDIHLSSTTRDQFEEGGNLSYLYIFGAIAGFIILIACINFMNLSTAKSAGRAKEVGLRKTLGSYRSHLILQFLTESLIYTFTATLLAYLMVWQALPGFNYISGKELSAAFLLEPSFLAISLLLIVLVGVLAGSYPAFYLTSFQVSEVLKGKVRDGMKGGAIRSTLVVVQFGISIFLIICTGVIYSQLQFFQNRNMGLDKNQVIVVQNTGYLEANRDAFREALEQKSAVVAASYTTNVVPGVNNTTIFRTPGSTTDHISGRYYADYAHQEALGFELVDGRYFSKEMASDSLAGVINEAAAREFGYAKAVGEEFIDFDGNGQERRIRIIGVIKDFNFESMKTEVRPLIIQLGTTANQMLVRYQGEPQQALASIEQTWKEIAPNQPFDYQFLDQSFDALFRSEQRMGYVFTVFTGLAIFIACLGLVGLSAFTAEKRTKEIGVRKVMGASNTSVLVMLNREFTRLVLIAFVISVPFAWWVMDQWLADFAFRISMNVWIFVGAGVFTFLVALLTVSWQSYKAAVSNPVKALKYE
ncbi:ABC transporter permease [Cytophagales bacterium LB-30]|uniref:ABC transporter permease n=1 Tax=Shiella aurantiaca TaxID=3058365 RepID=A0ABT8F477_9BACT|nr:ABC transporter permease [Shiella aurantiaca]MDN4165074.1 ABC transporter permease [Shiella aurantiaca]